MTFILDGDTRISLSGEIPAAQPRPTPPGPRMVTVGNATLYLGDSRDILPDLSQSIHAIVADPPYGLRFMNRHWDYDLPSADLWRLCLDRLSPGGHLLAFAGTRTQHRMAVNIEDAGFEIRDMIAWVYGSGFPKSLDVSKAIDKAAGAEREVIGTKLGLPGYSLAEDKGRGVACVAHGDSEKECAITSPATDAAKQWDGWGTALKPALEPITVARKPFSGTVAANVMEHGTGALNIDASRVGWADGKAPEVGTPASGGPKKKLTAVPGQEGTTVERAAPNAYGRWPANLIHDGSDEVVGLFPQTKSGKDATDSPTASSSGFTGPGTRGPHCNYGGTGSAARFFYCAKASKSDRGPDNHHPTVKPTDLMRYLCRLVTPPNGVVLDPFMGSGSTGKAALLEGFRFIGIERDPEYFEIAVRRMQEVSQ
jgi:site-specific DNA-methyltransferase (adenine-specific)